MVPGRNQVETGCLPAQEKERYVVCNGDEGIGAFMDCAVMEGIPHPDDRVYASRSYAVQAHEGYIYVRANIRLQ